MEPLKTQVNPKYGSLCMILQPELLDVSADGNLIIHLAGGRIEIPLMGLTIDKNKPIRLIMEMSLAQPS